MGSHGANILVIVFAKVVYSVGGVIFEIRERLKKLCSVHRGQVFERCMFKWECLIAWTNACLLFAGDELVSEHRVWYYSTSERKGEMDENNARRDHRLSLNTRRSARPKGSTVQYGLTLLFVYWLAYCICSPALNFVASNRKGALVLPTKRTPVLRYANPVGTR